MFLVNETYMSGFFVSVDVVYFLFLFKVLNKFRDFSFPELLDHKVYHTVHLLVWFPIVEGVFYQDQIGQWHS